MRNASIQSEDLPNGRGDAAAAPATGHARAALSGELRDLIADIEDLARQATTLTGEEFASAKARLSERLVAARGAAAQLGGSIAERARTTADATNHYVHEQPWKAIGIGATLGLLLGFALARR